MVKTKKLISLICTICMISTIVALPSIGMTGYAAAADAASYVDTTLTTVPRPVYTQGGSVAGSGTQAANGNYYAYLCTGTADGTSLTRAPYITCGSLPLGSSATNKIAHLSWTMNNPDGRQVDLKYRVNDKDDKSATYELATWSGNVLTDKVSGLNISAELDPTSYHADWFVDLETLEYRLYFNNILFADASLKSGSTKILRIFLDIRTKGDYSLTIEDPALVVYNKGTTMNDVVAYTLAGNNNNNYYWSVSGINTIDGVASYRLVGNPSPRNGGSGAVDGSNYVITASSSNANSGVGYRLRMLNSNGTNTTKGCLPQDSVNDNIIHQSLTITPNLSSGNTAAVGFRGNNAYQTDKYIFGEENGYENGKGYRFDILVNNKDKEYYILVDGEKCATGTTGNGYLAEFVYTIANAGSDTLFLSDIITTSYDYTVSMEEALSFISTEEELSIKDLTVLYDENSGYEISACAVFSNISQDFNSPKLIYTLYKNGALFDVDGKNIMEEIETTNDMVKLKYNNINRKYPYCLLKVDGSKVNSGDILTVKAYFVDNEITQLVSDEASFTIE